MKHSELQEMIRSVVQEKLTAKQKRKKEQIVKGMKKSFKGDESDMYAIATAKAKKIAEGEDHEVSMAISSLEAIAEAVIELRQKLGNQERNIPGWIQDHIAKAENYIEQAAQGFHELNEEKDPLDVVVSEYEEKKPTAFVLYDRVNKVKKRMSKEDFLNTLRSISYANFDTAEDILKKYEENLSLNLSPVEKDVVNVSEKKGKDLTGPSGKPDGKIDSADYLKARDIAIKKAQAKKK